MKISFKIVYQELSRGQQAAWSVKPGRERLAVLISQQSTQLTAIAKLYFTDDE